MKRFACFSLTILVLLFAAVGCSSKPSSSSTSAPSVTGTSTTGAAQQGETKTFHYKNLSLKITNVASEGHKTAVDDEGAPPREYQSYTLYPGAQLTVIHADMNDGTYFEDGLPHANWHISAENGGRYIPITDDMQPLLITSDMSGVIDSDGGGILGFDW